MTKYPTENPNTVCIYVISILPTIPGTDTNVTPDKEAPIIPNETIYQGDWRFPRKNASLLVVRRLVIREMSNSSPK